MQNWQNGKWLQKYVDISVHNRKTILSHVEILFQDALQQLVCPSRSSQPFKEELQDSHEKTTIVSTTS